MLPADCFIGEIVKFGQPRSLYSEQHFTSDSSTNYLGNMSLVNLLNTYINDGDLRGDDNVLAALCSDTVAAAVVG
jgi:hypothetical protein